MAGARATRRQGGDETIEVEPFTGIGFYSRPPSSGKPEAIATAIGGNKAMAVVATRDEATRQKMVGDLGDGETAIDNDLAKLVVRNDGTVAVLLPNGIAIPLALQLDLTILRAAINGAAISVGAGGAATSWRRATSRRRRHARAWSHRGRRPRRHGRSAPRS